MFTQIVVVVVLGPPPKKLVWELFATIMRA